jgi:flagellar hook-associated protein 2
MAGITSSVGLITGIPIEDTVKQLMALAARPRDLLKARTDGLKQEQTALDTLGSRLLSFQFSAVKLKSASVYTTREVISSKPDLLQVALPATGTPAVGSFQVRPVQVASAQQLVSQQFDASTTDLGEGTFSFRFGGFLDAGITLDQLNSGAGVPRGKIRITDRAGETAVIDLSFARTVDDVLQTINASTEIAVTASTSGDTFTLTDASGGIGNLSVQEVGGGSTAAGLGLAGISVAANQATGSDVFRLHSGTKIATLNDGNGVQISGEGVVDLDIDLHDGSSLQIDLADVTTLGELITQINAADPVKLSAAISADGNRIELSDFTAGGNNFTIANGVAGTTATDLGIATTTAAATITGGRLASGLRDTLLSSLNGGESFGALGQIQITDRNGGAATVNLAAAETLGDVISLINASAADVTASINTARNGLLVTDSSAGSGSLIVADNDGTNTATKLGIAINQAAASVNSGALKRQTLSEATPLASLNGGKGVVLGDIQITDSDGVTKTADLNTIGSEAKTIGDVITRINALTNGVEARINDTGDGILITDTADGGNKLGAKDLSGNVAASLNLTRASTTDEGGGQFIDGTSSFSVDLSDLELSSQAIPLASLNGGAGIDDGDLLITDSTGEKSIAFDLNGADAGITTVGQFIDAVNAKAAANGTGVHARMNDAGTGIYLEDTANGPKKMVVKDLNGTSAADLKIVGEAKLIDGKQVINGQGAFSSTSALQSGLNALAAKINSLKAGVTASTVFDGVGYRLSIASDATGAANALLVDAGDTSFQFQEVAKAQDALLLYGNFSTPGGGILVSSQDNTFDQAVGGVDLTVVEASESPITVTVTQTDKTLVDSLDDLVKSYNALRTDLDKLTAFDAEAATTGLLFGTSEALQIDLQLSRALTDRYRGVGSSFQSLEQIGLSVDENGMLSLDKARLTAAFQKDPEGVEDFLRTAESGVAARLSAVVDSLAGTDNSVLARRSDALKAKIETNEDRLEFFAERLERQQARLELQFFQLESVIAKLQASQTALNNIQRIPPLGSTTTQ